MFSFGKNKTEARIIGEFYTNAIHVMEGASLLGDGEVTGTLPAVRRGHGPGQLQGLLQLRRTARRLRPSASSTGRWKRPRSAASRRKRSSARIVLVVGGGSGIGREVARLAAQRGAHVVVADRDETAAAKVADELKSVTSKGVCRLHRCRYPQPRGIRKPSRHRAAFGGIDVLVNTAAMFPSSPDGASAMQCGPPHST
jgi:hypothetical protein